MSICKNCGQETTPNATFCGNCGSAMNNEPTPASSPEQNTQPTQALHHDAYTQQYPVAPAYPVYGYDKPVVPTGSKVKGYIGMGLSIEGFVMALFTLLYAFITLNVPYPARDGFAFVTMYLAFLQIAASIIGFCLSSSAKSSGFKSGAVTTGFVLGIVGMSIYLFSIFLAIIALAV